MRSAGSSPCGVSGAMTRASWRVGRRCSSVLITELLTPLTCGRKDSATIATRTPSRWQRRLSIWLPTGVLDTNSDPKGALTMRSYLGVLAAMLVLVMFTTNTAHADVPRTLDGDGVLVGSWIASVQLAIFCGPACTHCAEFESTDGDRLAAALATGRLAITYRWMTFLDGRHHNDVSARLTNALFLAADPATPPPAAQAFVPGLYPPQSADGPSTDAVAALARESGLPDVVADRIAAGDNAVAAPAA